MLTATVGGDGVGGGVVVAALVVVVVVALAVEVGYVPKIMDAPLKLGVYP